MSHRRGHLKYGETYLPRLFRRCVNAPMTIENKIKHQVSIHRSILRQITPSPHLDTCKDGDTVSYLYIWT